MVSKRIFLLHYGPMGSVMGSPLICVVLAFLLIGASTHVVNSKTTDAQEARPTCSPHRLVEYWLAKKKFLLVTLLLSVKEKWYGLGDHNLFESS